MNIKKDLKYQNCLFFSLSHFQKNLLFMENKYSLLFRNKIIKTLADIGELKN